VWRRFVVYGRLRPRVGHEHLGALQLVDRAELRLALGHDRLALATDHHRERRQAQPRHRDHAGHLEQQRDVLPVVDLVEERFLVGRDVHGGGEEIPGLDGHGSLLDGM
jgi:hypothetical protein